MDNQGRSWVRGILAYLGELIKVVVISLAIILPIRYFLVQPFYVKGASMEPNFYDHEYLVIDELSYRLHNPARGEIVVFRYPKDPSQFFIKRIIGLPGETVIVNNAEIKIVNEKNSEGVDMVEPYIEKGNFSFNSGTTKLGADEYFVMGDNRRSSLDSRIFGALPRQMIIGRVWLRGWPLERVARFVAPEYGIDGGGI